MPRSPLLKGVSGLTRILEKIKKCRNIGQHPEAKLIGIGVSIAINASSDRPIELAARAARASVQTAADSDVL